MDEVRHKTDPSADNSRPGLAYGGRPRQIAVGTMASTLTMMTLWGIVEWTHAQSLADNGSEYTFDWMEPVIAGSMGLGLGALFSSLIAFAWPPRNS